MANDVSNDPRKGDGWEGFLEGEDEIWEEAFETDEDGNIDVDQYDEFDKLQDIVNYVVSSGIYENTRSFTPEQGDLVDKKREMRNDHWKIPLRIEEIEEYLEEGAMRNEIDIDPNAAAKWQVSEKEANIDDHNKKYTAHFIVYDPEEEHEESNFYMAVSWYDEEPDELNLEDVYDIESIADRLR